MDTPVFNTVTIGPLLTAAEKYQTSTVFTWFEKEVLIRKSPIDETIHSTPLLEHPMLILSLAARHNLTTLVRYALRELTKCDIAMLNEDAYVDLKLYRHMMSLREVRIQWFFDAISSKLALYIGSSIPGKSNQRGCDHCSANRTQWVSLNPFIVLRITKALLSHLKSPMHVVSRGQIPFDTTSIP